MRKILNIAWKDLISAFREPGVVIMMLVTPFALTLVMGFAFGAFGGGNAGPAGIPMTIVNHDAGEFGQRLVRMLEADGLADLLVVTVLSDDAAARAAVDADQSAAAVIVPADFSEAVVPAGLSQGDTSGLQGAQPVTIELYANPTRPVSAGVVRTVAERFIDVASAQRSAGLVVVGQIVGNRLADPQAMAQQGAAIGHRVGDQVASTSLVRVVGESDAAGQSNFDWLGYMAPSMAILFLMFTVSAGGRTILLERDLGTLPRMLTTPTGAAQVLGGKVLGTYLTGLAQMIILFVASTLLLGVHWGAPAPVAALLLSLVAAGTGWGMLIAAYSKTTGQANAVGTALSLTFGALAGNFVVRDLLPDVLKKASLITPNAWGLDGFKALAAGGTLADVALPIAALWGMAAITFALAVVAFRRQAAQ
ncbi:MAG: ABC transporter permease [Chloroflexi bacterium]|nr:ABC transporter permease [Chloroflexota bacterium]